MDSVNVKDAVLDKKMNGYGFEENNFLAQSELTVTITLKEYRDLVEKVATRDSAIKTAEKDKYQRDSENENLKKEISALKAELYELQKKSDEPIKENNDEVE